MSGLEGLAVACNMMQLISFAHETFNSCQAVYGGRPPTAHLAENANELMKIAKELEATFSNPGTSTKGKNREMLNVVGRCSSAARVLKEEVDFINKEHGKGSWKATLRIAAKTKWRSDRLRKQEKLLKECQRLMESRLLAELCTQNSAIEVQQTENFAALDNTLQLFITQVAKGNKKLCNLVQGEAKMVAMHTSHEVQRAENTIMAHVSQEVSELSNTVLERMAYIQVNDLDKQQRWGVLHSLKFSSMNWRRNQIDEASRGTYEWIFDEPVLEPVREEQPESDLDTEPPSTLASPTEDNKFVPRLLNTSPKWDSFTEWLRSTSTIYWLSGKAGTGKSTLLHFILQHPQTISLLNAWRPGCVILSHFFWKAGSDMQHSVKGLLCSLLHQLLSEAGAWVISVLASFPGITRKNEPDDWSLTELHALLRAVLGRPGSSFCILIDGLDEASEEPGAESLLETVWDLMNAGNVKICASSRPEWRFEKHLLDHQHLRLQDLTKPDMRKFVSTSLEPDLLANSAFDAEHVRDLLGRLVERAEGIFLWLRLAVQNLRHGNIQGDTIEDLNRRLDKLPKKLSDLYFDMWSRLNQDDERYRQQGARFLNLVLLYKKHNEDPSLAAIATALDRTLFKKWRKAGNHELDFTELEERCTKTLDLIKLRCVGLLQEARSPYRIREKEEPLVECNVDFIHRSAYDFFIEIPEGQEILSLDPVRDTDEHYLQAARGYLIGTITLRQNQCGGVLQNGSTYDRSLNYLRVFDLLALCSTSEESEGAVSEIFLSTWTMFKLGAGDEGTDEFPRSASSRPRLDRETLIVYEECSVSRKLDAASKQESEDKLSRDVDVLITERLLDFMTNLKPWTSPSGLIGGLISFGANMRRRYDRTIPGDGSFQLDRESSALAHHVFGDSDIFTRLLRPDGRACWVPDCLDRFRDVVQVLLEGRPSLEEQAPFVFHVPLSALSPTQRLHQQRHGKRQSELASFEEWHGTLHNGNKIGTSLMYIDATTYVVIVNVAFLIQSLGLHPAEGQPETEALVEVPFALSKATMYTLHTNERASLQAASLFKTFINARIPGLELPASFDRDAKALEETCKALGGAEYRERRSRARSPIMAYLLKRGCGYRLKRYRFKPFSPGAERNSETSEPESWDTTESESSDDDWRKTDLTPFLKTQR